MDVPSKREMLEPYSENTDYSRSDSYNSNARISSDHYSRNNYNSNVDSDLDNKFVTISSSYNNDSRFASISSAPIQQETSYSNSDRFGSTSSDSQSTSSKVWGYLGYAYNISKDVAWAVKEKVVEMDLPTKLKPLGERALEGAIYVGGKMYEAGTEIAVLIFL
jgi:hypothetical protein